MKAHFVNESISDILKGKELSSLKDYIIKELDDLIKNRRIFIFEPSFGEYYYSGKGKVLEQRFFESLPLKINAGLNMFKYHGDERINKILKISYGLHTFNVNSIFGKVINVPFEKEWVKIQNRFENLFVYLKDQKIILRYQKNSTGLEPMTVYFDYDHLKETLERY